MIKYDKIMHTEGKGMKFKKPKKKDMPIIIITIVIVVILAISSAISKSEETGESLQFYQWVIVNAFIIGIAVVSDIGIINNREKKQKEAKIAKEKEKEKQERAQREITLSINIKSGAIGINGLCQMHQLFENNLFYFDDNIETLYEMIGYEWDGAKYKKITSSNSQEIETGKKKASGIAAGGMTIGGLGSSDSKSNKRATGEIVEKEIEEKGSAIIRMKRMSDEITLSFVIECDSEVDKKIRCFNAVPNN